MDSGSPALHGISQRNVPTLTELYRVQKLPMDAGNQAGAEANSLDKQGRTPLDMAVAQWKIPPDNPGLEE